jgi:DNA repair protein RadD
MQLRPYQLEAIDAVYRYLREHDDNPVIVIPTAGGKTPVMATICKDTVGTWQGRVIILAHVKELLEQAFDKLDRIAPELRVGVYSAGFGRRDTNHPVILAGIQSVYKRACDLGPFDLVLVDEAHCIAPEGDGMYRQFLAEMKVVNPRVRVIGLTATPFRMKSGMICAPENFLNAICYEIGVRQLIVDGYLCKLVTKAGCQKPDTSTLHVRAGEFIANETETLMNQDPLVDSACAEIAEYAKDRKSCLIFSSGVKHGEHLAEVLRRRAGSEVGTVFGNTLAFERARTLDDFRKGKLKYLVNVNVLTTGFDAPNIDCLALVRPTMSPGLYYQMCGRGFRIHPGKQDCLVLDFGGNVLRHGPVDQIKAQSVHAGNGMAPAKECPQCHSVIAAGYATCPDCGYAFPPPERQKHDGEASTAGILSGQVTKNEYLVKDVLYSVHTKRGAPPEHPKTLRVDYEIGFNWFISEWVCPEHSGYARWKFEKWWKSRSLIPPPKTAEEAAALAQDGALAPVAGIICRHVAGEQHEQVVGHVLGTKPRMPGMDDEPVMAPAPAAAAMGLSDEEIPF